MKAKLPDEIIIFLRCLCSVLNFTHEMLIIVYVCLDAWSEMFAIFFRILSYKIVDTPICTIFVLFFSHSLSLSAIFRRVAIKTNVSSISSSFWFWIDLNVVFYCFFFYWRARVTCLLFWMRIWYFVVVACLG